MKRCEPVRTDALEHGSIELYGLDARVDAESGVANVGADARYAMLKRSQCRHVFQRLTECSHLLCGFNDEARALILFNVPCCPSIAKDCAAHRLFSLPRGMGM